MGLGGERDMKRLARARQTHHEQPRLHQHAGDPGIELTEVDLRLRSRRVRLRHRHLDGIHTQLEFAAGDIARDRHFRARRAVFGDQPLPDPPRRMPLLPRHLPIRKQPPVNDLGVAVDHRPPTRRIGPPRRRNRVPQCLAHCSTMRVMLCRQFADRQLPITAVTSDLLEQLHLRPGHFRPPRRQHRREDPNQGGANIRDDTLHPPPASSPPRWGQHS